MNDNENPELPAVSLPPDPTPRPADLCECGDPHWRHLSGRCSARCVDDSPCRCEQFVAVAPVPGERATAEELLGDAAREIPWVSGPVAHRIRVLRESHAAAIDALLATVRRLKAALAEATALTEDVFRERDQAYAELAAERTINQITEEQVRRLEAERDALRADKERLDWLEARAMGREGSRVEINFTEAWTEHGEAGSILSSGPREFWLRDDGIECGPTLRDAIDAGRLTSPEDTASE